MSPSLLKLREDLAVEYYEKNYNTGCEKWENEFEAFCHGFDIGLSCKSDALPTVYAYEELCKNLRVTRNIVQRKIKIIEDLEKELEQVQKDKASNDREYIALSSKISSGSYNQDHNLLCENRRLIKMLEKARVLVKSYLTHEILVPDVVDFLEEQKEFI